MICQVDHIHSVIKVLEAEGKEIVIWKHVTGAYGRYVPSSDAENLKVMMEAHGVKVILQDGVDYE